MAGVYRAYFAYVTSFRGKMSESAFKTRDWQALENCHNNQKKLIDVTVFKNQFGGNWGLWYRIEACSEDRATLGSDLSAEAGACKDEAAFFK